MLSGGVPLTPSYALQYLSVDILLVPIRTGPCL